MSQRHAEGTIMEMRFGSNAANHYIRKRMRSIGGWLEPLSAKVIAKLSLYQVERGFVGNVAEIGIHHGKLFFVLYLTTRKDERAIAIDVFEAQHLNIDKSGSGDKAIFMSHARRISKKLEGIEIIEDSSLNVTSEKLLCHGPIRMMSVDGGHLYNVTTNDLMLADATLSEEGIVIADDVFNEYWPEVSVALAKILLDRTARLIPFAITPNKVFLSRPHMASSYRKTLAESFPFASRKGSNYYGYTTTIFGRPPMTWTARFGQTRVGEAIKRVVNPARLAVRKLLAR